MSGANKFLDKILNESVPDKFKIKNDEVGKFWVVTKPTGQSTIQDICFEADVARMIIQIRGGLEQSEIVGMYRDEVKAFRIANRLIKSQSKE